ncbi:hypothetical protein HDA35_001199 [Micromonospora purpureochromogenes]|uniref:FXSXX-COOH protein n=1 Tax=Micromonospora purpureochromogenes TaxID=47872 RepID=A0ABX2RFU7_9ACTN|nr:hypothetical protein [Micromonospora purpureochromogenes]
MPRLRSDHDGAVTASAVPLRSVGAAAGVVRDVNGRTDLDDRQT